MAGGAKGLGEGDLAVSVGGLGDVVVADVVEVVVDGDGFAGEGGGAALEGGGEGDGWPTVGVVVDGSRESWVGFVTVAPEFTVNAFMQMFVLARRCKKSYPSSCCPLTSRCHPSGSNSVLRSLAPGCCNRRQGPPSAPD